MVQRGYTGLGSQREAVRLFDELSTHVAAMLAMQAGFPWGSAEHMAFGIALDGLETAAHHFTRRRHYYDGLRRTVTPTPGGGFAGPDGAQAAFAALGPYVKQLRRLQDQCRPFGRDYLALEIAQQAFSSCAYHFTRGDGP